MTLLNDSYVATRLTLLSSRLLQADRKMQIIDADLAQLQQLYPCIANVPDVGSVEKRLVNQALDDFQILFRPFNSIKRDVLDYAVHWYELSNLKALIRGKLAGKKEYLIQQQLIDVGSFAALPLQRLLQADDQHEMLRLLEETPYASIVRQARLIYEEEGQNLFALDAAIDRLFFAGLMHRIKLLDKKDRDDLMHVYGALLDRFNLLWLIRYRFSYGLSAAKSYFLLATSGRKLHAGNLMQLARINSLEEVISSLPEPLNNLLASISSLTEIEKNLERYTMEVSLKYLRSSASVITRVFCYILLREAEVSWLQALIKGKMLNFENSLIHKAIGVAS